MAEISPLALHLIGEDQVRARLALLDPAAAAAYHQEGSLLHPCQQWPAVRDILLHAVTDKRPVLIYGDYDVDGTVASFMLFRYLRSLGVPGNVFLPSRFRHGYGLDKEVLAQAAAHGYQTLIALDCGTANLDEIVQAQAAGMEVAVIDHHELKAGPPGAPLLNPHLDQVLPPLCTAGLVFEVLCELAASGNGGMAGDEQELAGLATIADIVPLNTRNWFLAHMALKRLPHTQNTGMLELIKASQLHGLDRLTSTQAAFQLIPRLNAAGRMRSARVALDLFSAADPVTARSTAQELERLNSQRKTEADQVFRKALLQSTQYEDKRAVALYGKDWHIGILGIVAARIAGQLQKPVVVLTDDPRQAGVLAGSARSAHGVNLVNALRSDMPGLVSYGGHAAAIGLKVRAADIETFREAWDRAVSAALERVDTAPDGALPPGLPEVALHELTTQFDQDMWNLAPFGPGYPAPRCVLRGVRIARVSYMGRDKTHLNLVVAGGGCEVRIAAFNQSHLYSRLAQDMPVRPAVEIDVDNWNNVNTISLRLLAVD